MVNGNRSHYAFDSPSYRIPRSWRPAASAKGHHARERPKVATIFPADNYDRLFFTGVQVDVWIEEGKEASQGALYRDKAAGKSREESGWTRIRCWQRRVYLPNGRTLQALL